MHNGLRVLFTIQTLERPIGGSLYVRDFANELLRQGHRPVVYCRRLGAVSDQILAAGIAAIDSLDRLDRPDIIHGNSPVETAAAILHFSDVPALFVCHGWDSQDAMGPRFPQIRRYLAVSEHSRDRLVYLDGIPEDRIEIHQNPVDLSRFRRRTEPLRRLTRALAFSNTLSEGDHMGTLRAACAEAGIELDAIGERHGNPCANPEEHLSRYDLVFARGRAALEAAAAGCAVILCDERGLGEMLTTRNYAWLRRQNFGIRTLQGECGKASVLEQIGRFDAGDCELLSNHVREREGLTESAQRLVDIYRRTIEDFGDHFERDCAAERMSGARFLETIAPYSNTFHVADQIRPYDDRARRAEAKLRRLSETLSCAATTAAQRAASRTIEAGCPALLHTGQAVQASLTVRNESDILLSSWGEYPVFISYHWLETNGGIVWFEGARGELFPPLPPGKTCCYATPVEAPGSPGEYILRLTLVQENVAWFDSDGAYRDIYCKVVAG